MITGFQFGTKAARNDLLATVDRKRAVIVELPALGIQRLIVFLGFRIEIVLAAQRYWLVPCIGVPDCIGWNKGRNCNASCERQTLGPPYG